MKAQNRLFKNFTIEDVKQTVENAPDNNAYYAYRLLNVLNEAYPHANADRIGEAMHAVAFAQGKRQARERYGIKKEDNKLMVELISRASKIQSDKTLQAIIDHVIAQSVIEALAGDANPTH